MTEDGKQCSDIGKLNLNDKNECRWAARNRRIGSKRYRAIGAFNGETRNEVGIQKGCSYNKVRKEFIWNKHPVGGRDSNNQAVCFKSGKRLSFNLLVYA